MVKILVKKINYKHKDLPKYETLGSSGLDLIANIDKEIIIKPNERVLIPTGLAVAIPESYEIQVRPRSGLAAKNGINVDAGDLPLRNIWPENPYSHKIPSSDASEKS